MSGITFGDIIFILFVCAVIYGIMVLVTRSRSKGGGGHEDNTENGSQEENSSGGP